MAETRDIFTKIVPNLFELDKATDPPTLYLDAVSEGTVTISSDPWDGIRTSQSLQLYVGDLLVKVQRVPPRDGSSMDDQLGRPPIFNISAKEYFHAGTSSSIRLDIYEGPTPNPNAEKSKTLSFLVKQNSLVDSLKIDITEGAAGYTDKHPYLMPANVAVIRGPAGMELEARSGGAVRFQDTGGATSCIFSFDNMGVCPLVLIRIDSLHESGQSNASQDKIILTRRNSTDVLVEKPVVFGDYVPATSDAAAAFDSVSCNTVGIADGITICVVSMIMKDPALQDKLYIKLADGLTLAEKTFNKGISTDGDIELPFTQIVNGVAEFGITARAPGKYSVGVFPSTAAAAYWNTTIEYRALP